MKKRNVLISLLFLLVIPIVNAELDLTENTLPAIVISSNPLGEVDPIFVPFFENGSLGGGVNSTGLAKAFWENETIQNLDTNTFNTTTEMQTAVNSTIEYYQILVKWANIINKFITAVDSSWFSMSGTTLEFNEAKLNDTIDQREKFNSSSDFFAVANNGSLLGESWITNGTLKAQNVTSSMFLSKLFWTNLTIKPLNLSSSMFLSFNWHENSTWQTGSELFVPYDQDLNTTSKVDFQDINVTGDVNSTYIKVQNITYANSSGTPKWRTYVNGTGSLITEYIE